MKMKIKEHYLIGDSQKKLCIVHLYCVLLFLKSSVFAVLNMLLQRASLKNELVQIVRWEFMTTGFFYPVVLCITD